MNQNDSRFWLFNEKSLINFVSLIAMRQEKIAKPLVPLSWGLFESIQGLFQLLYIIRILVILKVRWLWDIDLLIDEPIEKCIIHIHLKQFETTHASKCKQLSHNFWSGHRCKGFIIVTVFLLIVTFGNQPSFVSCYQTSFIRFIFEHPLGSKDIHAVSFRNKRPHIISGELIQLIMHGSNPTFILKCTPTNYIYSLIVSTKKYLLTPFKRFVLNIYYQRLTLTHFSSLGMQTSFTWIRVSLKYIDIQNSQQCYDHQ